MLTSHQMEPLLVLDISRLISRAEAAAATGIDRVELAYARHLLDYERGRAVFCAMHPLGMLRLLPTGLAEVFINKIEARWGGDKKVEAQTEARRLQRKLFSLPDRIRSRASSPKGRRIVYLLTSHHHLTRPAVIARALKRWDAVFIAMIHDLIPLEYPEYSRPREPARHARRMHTIASLADGVIVPSDFVGRVLHDNLRENTARKIPIWTVRHGVPDVVKATSKTPPPKRSGDDVPYFVCLGTIEPRKNHLLLLNLWREMVRHRGAAAPRLVLIGKRGWENENIVDMLERCPALTGKVEECNGLPDKDVIDLMRGARGLLFPTFSEGFGLPLVEALTLGVPAICSDIPVLREVGGDIPVYIDPTDGPGWLAAIREFCGEGPRYVVQRNALVTSDFWGWTESVEASINKIDLFHPEVETHLA